jgi:hypothetical protein
MPRLRNRQLSRPGGHTFYQPETKWQPRNGSSFQGIVEALIAHRQSQPYLAKLHKWSTDRATVEDEVDVFNASICERMGWKDYIMTPAQEPPSPRFRALSAPAQSQLSAAAEKVKKVWQGIKSINDWLDSGEPAVASELAESRAAICVACPLNGKGGIDEWFTKPASEVVKKQFERSSEKKLFTSVDDNLGVCQACLCPLKLVVQTPLKFKLAHIGDETKRALHASCWLRTET